MTKFWLGEEVNDQNWASSWRQYDHNLAGHRRQHCLPTDTSYCTVVMLTSSAIPILVMLTSLESSILVMLTLLESQILVMLTSPESQLLRGFQLPKLIWSWKKLQLKFLHHLHCSGGPYLQYINFFLTTLGSLYSTYKGAMAILTGIVLCRY